MDLAADYALPLPMKVIALMIGIPGDDWLRFTRWSDSILKISHARSGTAEAAAAMQEFAAVTGEMAEYLQKMIAQRQALPRDDLLTRLIEAQVEGERLTPEEILGFFQLLVVGGQETTTNLINNAMLCFLEHPAERTRFWASPELLPSAIEEVLRYRSPLQWLIRTPRRQVELHGQTISAGKLVLPVIGSANRDSKQFPHADRFDITRDPNSHLAFGNGIHACLGAPLARLEARIALTDLLERIGEFELIGDGPWQPRQALNVHGPASLPIRFKPGHK